MKECKACRKPNPDGTKHCQFCGHPLLPDGEAGESGTDPEQIREDGPVQAILRYVLAILACGAIELVHVGLCILFGWKRGGGYVVIGLVMAAMAATWSKITKRM